MKVTLLHDVYASVVTLIEAPSKIVLSLTFRGAHSVGNKLLTLQTPMVGAFGFSDQHISLNEGCLQVVKGW
jgi:hypothetical protein